MLVKAVPDEEKISERFNRTGTKSIGTTNGVPCVVSGPIIQVEVALNSVEQIRQAIRNLDPFECSDWDALSQAIVEEYDYDNWRTSLVWIIGSIRSLKQFEKLSGSWNVPMRVVWGYQEEKPAFKVLRQRWDFKSNIFKKEYAFEFHQDTVSPGKWLDAHISGSPGLTGITIPENAKFHMLYDKRQAEAYLGTRTNTPWFTPQEAVIKEVKGKMFHTIDLVYVPPVQWVWGIDASQMYIEL